jgi:putative peptidoglycan lipid II flippase
MINGSHYKEDAHLHKEQNSLFFIRSVSMIMLATILSRVLGFFREMAIAYRFGTTMEADAYLVAVLLPTILFYSFSDALKSTFITVFAPYKGDEDAPFFLNSLTFFVAIALLVLVVLGIIFAPQLVFLLAPGFKGEIFTLTVRLMRIMLPGIFFVGLAGLASGFLNSYQRFLIPALVNVPHNLIIILSALYLGLHYGVTGLAWGSLLAIVSQLVIQLPSLCRVPFNFRRGFSTQHPGLKKIYSLLPAIILSSAVIELKHLVDRLFASFLAPGSIAALNYAERIYMLPQAIFVSAIIIILYPQLVELHAKSELDFFKQHIRQGISFFFFLLLPMAAGLILLRRPLVELLFQRGAFDASATNLTATALLFYTPGLVGFALHCFCNRIFFALQEVKVLVWVNTAMVGSNALFNLLLMPVLGHGGIALGTSLSFILGSLWLLILLSRRLDLSIKNLIFIPLCRSFMITTLMAILLHFYLSALVSMFASLPGGIFILVTTTFLGAVAYFLFAFLLRLPEVNQVLTFAKSFMKQNPTIFKKKYGNE